MLCGEAVEGSSKSHVVLLDHITIESLLCTEIWKDTSYDLGSKPDFSYLGRGPT